MHFQHLTDIHTARHTQRIEHNVKRRAVRQERHVFRRKNTRNDTFVTVAACHLIADRDFSLLSDIDAHDLVDSGRKLVGIVA